MDLAHAGQPRGRFFIQMSGWIGEEKIDLSLTLINSAQCFYWVERGEAYGAVIGGEPVWLRADAGAVYAEGGDADRLRAYLDLGRDYDAVANAYREYAQAHAAMRMYPGLRVLNQPAWETLISFILSANNNVERIRALVHKLMVGYGAPHETVRGTLYAFPTPERLARCAPEELRALGMGYRDKYIIGTARAVVEGFPLEALRGMEYEKAHAALITLAGVGDKVADCVQLFGLGHSEAFPVDVWVARIAQSVFGIDAPNRRTLARQARAMLGKNAGILQQFLFHAARTGAMEV